MKAVIWLGVFFVVAASVSALAIRSVEHDPERWHVDPETVADIDARNQYLGRATLEAPPDRVFTVLAADVYAGRLEVIAGERGEGFVTYVERSRFFGFPDYITVRAVPHNGGSCVTIYSRSRFGYSDLGVNRKRVEEWIALLKRARADRV